MGQISELLLQEYLGKKSPKYYPAEALFRVLQNNYSHGIVCPYIKKPSPALRNSWLLVWILRSEKIFFSIKLLVKRIKIQERSAQRFGNSYLGNHLVKFCKIGLNPVELEL